MDFGCYENSLRLNRSVSAGHAIFNSNNSFEIEAKIEMCTYTFQFGQREKKNIQLISFKFWYFCMANRVDLVSQAINRRIKCTKQYSWRNARFKLMNEIKKKKKKRNTCAQIERHRVLWEKLRHVIDLYSFRVNK